MENLLHYSKTGNNHKVRAIIEEHYLPFSISPDIFTDNYGRTACWLAILNSWTFYELPQYLVNNGASLEVKDVYGKTILHEVIRTKNLNAFKFLLKNNIRICGAIVGYQAYNYVRHQGCSTVYLCFNTSMLVMASGA